MEKITSSQNQRIKELKKLEKSGERKAKRLILIEGLRETILAARAGYEITELFICEEIFKHSLAYPLSELSQLGLRFSISKPVYDYLAYRETTEGIIATARPKDLPLADLRLKKNPLVLVIESVEKPGNLGAMLRTCDAAGIDAVIICDARSDIYNPNVIRSSLGTVFTNTIAVCSSKEALAFLQENNLKVVTAEPEAVKKYYEQDFTMGAALVVGSEAEGLSALWSSVASERVKIPMAGKIDSLNVSASAAIILFEAVRQRAPKPPKGA